MDGGVELLAGQGGGEVGGVAAQDEQHKCPPGRRDHPT